MSAVLDEIKEHLSNFKNDVINAIKEEQSNSSNQIDKKLDKILSKERTLLHLLIPTLGTVFAALIAGYFAWTSNLQIIESQEKIIIMTTIASTRSSQKLAEAMSKICPLLSSTTNREHCFSQIDSVANSGSIFVRGKVIEANLSRPIENVSILNDYDKSIVKTDRDGEFILVIDSRKATNLGLVLFKSGYLDEKFSTTVEGFFQDITIPMRRGK